MDSDNDFRTSMCRRVGLLGGLSWFYIHVGGIQGNKAGYCKKVKTSDENAALLSAITANENHASRIPASSLLCGCTLIEIISKVKEPPPLCRPILSVDEAPLDVIQVVKQAWSEEPERRPTFEEIFKQVGPSIQKICSFLTTLQHNNSVSSLSHCSSRASPKGRRQTL